MKTFNKAIAERLVAKYEKYIANLSAAIECEDCTDRNYLQGMIRGYRDFVAEMKGEFGI